jgi:hypothetical protein
VLPYPQDLGGPSPHVLPVVVSKEPVAATPFTSGRAILGASASGQYVSCCWPAGRRYCVWYRTLTGGWQEVDSGLGVDLAWHSHRWGPRARVQAAGHRYLPPLWIHGPCELRWQVGIARRHAPDHSGRLYFKS